MKKFSCSKAAEERICELIRLDSGKHPEREENRKHRKSVVNNWRVADEL